MERIVSRYQEQETSWQKQNRNLKQATTHQYQKKKRHLLRISAINVNFSQIAPFFR
jgi:hypothetical protein